MSENNNFQEEYLDISSSSKPSKKKNNLPELGKYVEKYGNGLFKHMGGIIKFIAFLICFSIIIVSFVAAFFFRTNSGFGNILFFSIIGGGTSIALIILFMIYGMGHMICQNNAILTRLNQLLSKDE